MADRFRIEYRIRVDANGNTRRARVIKYDGVDVEEAIERSLARQRMYTHSNLAFRFYYAAPVTFPDGTIVPFYVWSEMNRRMAKPQEGV